MDTTHLREAYTRFVQAAQDLQPGPPPDGEWPAELILAHIIVGDRLNSQAAAEVLAGRTPRFDNRPSQSVPYLQAVARAAGSWSELVNRVKQGGDELIAVAEAMSDELAETLVDAYVQDHDRALLDGPAPIGRVLSAPARVHLPGHLEQLQALTKTPAHLAG